MSRNTETYDIEDHELERFKREIKKEAYSLFDNYNFWNELNIRKEEYLALQARPNTEFFMVRIQSECKKMRTRKNSVFGLFSRSEGLSCNKNLTQGDERVTQLF